MLRRIEYMNESIKTINYLGKEHGNFNQEWLAHHKASELWYATGLLNDENNNLYSYQIVLIKTAFGNLEPWSTQLALTDFTNNKHYFFEKAQKDGEGYSVGDNFAKRDDLLSIEKSNDGFIINAEADNFSISLQTEFGKGAFWHADNGYLVMGKPELGSTTYYSYPSMPTTGKLILDDKTIQIKGNSWFDKQGGEFQSLNPLSQWEWFSLRFKDNEQVMLFSFPQDDYQDGTYITDHSQRLNKYTITPKKIIEVDGIKFSSGWDIDLPGIKDEHYTLEPIMAGQRNGAYYEQVSRIFDSSNNHVGDCVVELLPGARTPDFKSDWGKR